ncbi:hypothetical protein K1719_038459 [Acacia pycnantha]|nr:hypothetical protein K1719_038459 [Acacia pycnantha]
MFRKTVLVMGKKRKGKKRKGKKRKERSPETANNVGGETSSTSDTLTLSPEKKRRGKKRMERSPETADNVGGESSSTSNTLTLSPKWDYDVFLSFYGKDTRLNFTDHLYEAFISSGIRCFKDDVDLPRGKDIGSLLQVIKDSLCAVLVISENYAKSPWCLDELQTILESRQNLGGMVFPIFYNVNPDDVTYQKGSFRKAFAKHEKKFKGNTTKVQNWRSALSNIGNISGVDSRGKHEVDLIKNIVGDVWRFLSAKLPSSNDYLVGIDSKVADMIPLLDIGLDDKRFVGIWGMSGVGKTTLARAVFEKLSHSFEIFCFLRKVKEKLSLPEGLVSMQQRLLSGLKMEGLKIHDSSDGLQIIKSQLWKKKVLLVLDDIDHKSQFEDLVGSLDWFGKGSRIIITTKDSHVLTSIRVKRKYEMKTMNDDESLQIFSEKAFNKNDPEEKYFEEKYLKYSKSVVKCVGGLPVALQALGTYLCGRRKEAEWRDALDKLKLINPHKEILKVLELSYDGLDEEEKTIFLDIVCFFKLWKIKEVTQILEDCDLNPTLGIKRLIEKTLLVEIEDGRLDMHELYKDLGWNLIQQKSCDLQPTLGIKGLVERTLLVETEDGRLDIHELYEDSVWYIIQQKPPSSRLWKFDKMKEVLKNHKGFGEIAAIVWEDKYSYHYFRRDGDKKEVHPEVFSDVSRFRLLLLSCATNVPTGLKKLSCALKFVRWPIFPLEALPLPLDELVHIEMDHSNLKQLWNGIKSMNHLKFIDLRGSRNFTETPDFSNVQSLEHLRLSWCVSLVKVHESLGMLKKLVEVNLYGCKNLNSLPSKLETNSLRKLDLNGCEKVEKLPDFGDGMEKLLYVDASHTAITSLPESLGSLTGLRYLSLCETRLINLSSDCFSGLVELVFLSLEDCKSLVSLPRLPPRLIRLEAAGCSSMKCSLDEQISILVTSLDHEWRGKTKYVSSNEEEENMLFPYDEDLEETISLSLELKDVELEYDPLRNFIAIMPSGGKIPSWFGPNIKYCDEERDECEIEVEVPPNFRASKWSGIVVCLQLKRYEGKIRWSFKAPEDDIYYRWAGVAPTICGLYGEEGGLCIVVLEFNGKTCWQHLRGDNNFLHIQLSPDNDVSMNIFGYGSLHISGYGWRVICKEDV